MMAGAVLSYLAGLGHGTQGTDLFLGFQPDKPEDCITCYDEPAPVLEESSGLAVDQFGVQVLVRNASYTAARDALVAIHKDLAGFGGARLVAGTPVVTQVFVDSAPASIGRDEKGRAEWTAHYRLRVSSEGDLHRL